MTVEETASSLEDTLAALESAKELVTQLEERVNQLTLGDYEVLKDIATEMHQMDCQADHTPAACTWHGERHRPDPWFMEAHRRWIETAYRAVNYSGGTAAELLAALKLVDKARSERR